MWEDLPADGWSGKRRGEYEIGQKEEKYRRMHHTCIQVSGARGQRAGMESISEKMNCF